MPTPLDLLADHFSATRGFRHSHTIELRGGPLTVWWSQWTCDQEDFVFHDLTDQEIATRRFRPERLARAFWRKAEHESGERMFTASDLLLINAKVDPRHVKTLGYLMIADLEADSAAGGEGAGAGKDPPIGKSPEES